MPATAPALAHASSPAHCYTKPLLARTSGRAQRERIVELDAWKCERRPSKLQPSVVNVHSKIFDPGPAIGAAPTARGGVQAQIRHHVSDAAHFVQARPYLGDKRIENRGRGQQPHASRRQPAAWKDAKECLTTLHALMNPLLAEGCAVHKHLGHITLIRQHTAGKAAHMHTAVVWDGPGGRL